jgi:hypothetical protein
MHGLLTCTCCVSGRLGEEVGAPGYGPASSFGSGRFVGRSGGSGRMPRARMETTQVVINVGNVCFIPFYSLERQLGFHIY